MRMPRPQFGLNPDRQRCFLHAFVKLKQMGMARADPDPDYFYGPFWRESANAFDGKKKRAELNCSQFLAQRQLNILANLGEKTECKMDLIAGSPSNAADPRIEFDQNVPDRFRRIDGNEEPA